jgi:hypothetical protein
LAWKGVFVNVVDVGGAEKLQCYNYLRELITNLIIRSIIKALDAPLETSAHHRGLQRRSDGNATRHLLFRELFALPLIRVLGKEPEQQCRL